MNKYQIGTASNNFAGKIQEEIGKIIGSKSQQKYGRARQIDGKFAELFGDARELIKESLRNR